MLFTSIHIQTMLVVVEIVAVFSLSPGFPSVISLDNAVLCDVRAMYTVVSVCTIILRSLDEWFGYFKFVTFS